MSNKSKSTKTRKTQGKKPRTNQALKSKSQTPQNPNHRLATPANPKKSLLTSLRLFLFFSFPPVLYFSYHPVIPLFSSTSTNYELSLPLLWLALFALLSLPDAFRAVRSFVCAQPKPKWQCLLPFLFPFYLFLSCLWSPNPLRGFLTASIFLCLLISAYSVYSYKNILEPPQLVTLKKIFLGSAVLISLFCWLQSILDVVGLSRSATLLCPGCTSRIFGFPHPSGFAIEPQFMGNLLLAPTLYSFYEFFHHHLRFPVPLFLLTTLFVIFSRGALYSFALALAFLFLVELFRNQNRRALLALPLSALALALCLISQLALSRLSPYRTSTSCTLSTSLAQLSLNTINPPCNPEPISPNGDTANDTPNDASTPVFTGYVEESTNVRLNLSSLALASALKSPARLIFGTGLGSAGTVLYQDGATASPKEIIQNEYLSLLLETGLLGLALLLLSLILLVRYLWKKQTINNNPLLPATALSSATSLLFFSGLPNALHIYLFPVYLLLLTSKNFPPSKKSPTIQTSPASAKI